jgi:hypothetical protein
MTRTERPGERPRLNLKIERCPCCGCESLEVVRIEHSEKHNCELCGYRLVPTVPSRAHVGNAVAFVSAACRWFEERNLDIPLDQDLARALREGAEVLAFSGEREVGREEAERLAEEFEIEVVDRFYVRE